jgi:hypothetical protein
MTSRPDSTSSVIPLSNSVIFCIFMKFSFTLKTKTPGYEDLVIGPTTYYASRSFAWSRCRLVLKEVYSPWTKSAHIKRKLFKYSFRGSNRLLIAMSNYSKGLASVLLNTCVGISLRGPWASLWSDLHALFKFLASINVLTLTYLLNLRLLPLSYKGLPRSPSSYRLRLTDALMSKNIKLL